MISGFGSPPPLRHSAAASAIARTCIANRPGITRPRRTPRRPSIGFCSCIRRTAVSSTPSWPGSSPVRLGDRHLRGQLLQRRQELVQRRVDEPDGHRQPVHRRQDLDEVGALQRQQGGQGGVALVVVVGQDQPFDQLTAVAEEHVLGAAQADTLGAEAAGAGGVGAGVGVGPHLQPAGGVGVRQQPVYGRDQRVSRRPRARPRSTARRATAGPAPRRGTPCHWCRRWRSRRLRGRRCRRP